MMRKNYIIWIFAFLLVFAGNSSAIEVTVFGPNQYTTTQGGTDVFTDTFSAVAGEALLIVKNGDYTGNHRVEDGVSSARIYLNGAEIFAPSDFNQNVYLLETAINVGDSNSISIELNGTSGRYITVEITEQVPEPTVTVNADPDAVYIAEPSTLTWNSSDADTCVIDQGVGDVPVNGSIEVFPAETTTYTITATGLGGTASAQVTVTLLNSPPVASDDTYTGDEDTVLTISPGVLSNDTDADSDSLSATLITDVSSGLLDLNADGSFTYTPNKDFNGTDAFTYKANDGLIDSNIVTATITVAPVNDIPTADAGQDQTVLENENVQLDGSGSIDIDGDSLTYSWSFVSVPDGSSTALSDPNTLNPTFVPDTPGTYILELVVSDSEGSSQPDSVVITAEAVEGQLPPDPTEVAPPVDQTVATTIFHLTEFLYTGSDPIQTGVDPLDIEPQRTAVLRGRVLDRDDNSLDGVTITILDHPEFGQTLSRSDGMFDMVVNGGGELTVTYEKEGFLPVQRQVRVPWQDYTLMPDVVMIQVDDQVTPIDLTSSVMQVARGSVQTDADGTRQATILFPAGTSAEMVMPDGSAQPITDINVRATEYTVGDNGPNAMPGKLPPTSGYTYAVELSVDEAVAAGAKQVSFSQPVPFYVENFLDFPVGGIVPVGYYDRDRAAWIPSDNGLIIQIISINNGIAELDVDGSGLPADSQTLIDSGITDAEREQLASLYSPGTSLWRVPVTHFTPWDHNWPYGPPDDAEAPTKIMPQADPKLDDPCQEKGSIIECENQVLGESTALTGAKLSLNYRSDRVPGRKTAYGLNIPLSGDSIPASLKRIELEITVAGRIFSESFSALPNQSYLFTWDGMNAYGQKVQGDQPIRVQIGFVYDAVYYEPSQFGRAFSQFSGVSISGSSARQEITLWLDQRTNIGGWDARSTGLGGWTLSEHHAYDPLQKVLYMGNGVRRSAEDVNRIITTVAGNGSQSYSGDNGPATEAGLSKPQDVAVGPDGSIYIADRDNRRIRKVDTSGIITTVAGGGSSGLGDGGPATEAWLYYPFGVAVGSDGSIYIADYYNHRIRKVDPSGIITTVAGNGSRGYSGDGGPATEAGLYYPFGVAVGPDGSIYIANFYNRRIRKIDPFGIITTVAGNGSVAFSGDGGPATEAGLYYPFGVTTSPDGSFYIALNYGNRIRRVDPSGIITTVAGNGSGVFSGDDGPATKAGLSAPSGVAVGPDGSIYIADRDNHRVRRVKSTLPEFDDNDIVVSSEDGGKLYQFDANGKHLSTINTLTGTVLYQFSYDSNGYLIEIEDADGDITTIQRDAGGNPTAIISQDGQKTTLTLDSNGYLAKITNPANEATDYVYTSDGLLTSVTDPRGNASTMTYDTVGRLIKDENPLGGFWQLNRSVNADGFTVDKTSALNRLTTYEVRYLSTGDRQRLLTDPGGFTTETLIETNGATTINSPDGTITTIEKGPDPRFGMQAPITEFLSITTPGGLSFNQTIDRVVTLTDESDLLSLQSRTDTIDINGRTYTRVYDAAGRTDTMTTPEGRQSTTTIDALGRIIQEQITGLESIHYSYDTRGRLSSILTGAGLDERVFTLTYNAEGFLESITDPLNRSTGFRNDPVGRITRQTLPDLREIDFSYDANGNVTSITPPGQPAHFFDYTAVNLTETYDPPDIGITPDTTSYSYSLDKELTQVLRPDGDTVDFTYNATTGQLTAMTIPGGAYAYAYDPATGNLTTISDPDGGTLSYIYDGFLLTDETWSGNVAGTVTRGYDNNFRVTSLSVNSDVITYGYDNDGLLTAAGSLTLSRDAQNGLLTGTTLGNVTTSLSHNGFAEVTGESASYSGTLLYDASFVFDKLGRIIEKTETIDSSTNTYTYGYDLAGRLETVNKNGVVASTYAYNDNGNRLSLTTSSGTVNGTYDDHDRLITYGSAAYTYTANGELETKTVGSDITTYDYDELGNLISVTLPDGTFVEYIIDGRNRRVAKLVDGVFIEGYLYQGQLNPVAKVDDTGNMIERYVYADKGNVPAYMIKGATSYRIISDHLGSPRIVVDINTGDILQRMDYDEFGNIIMDTNSGFQPFAFAGGLYDQHTGLVRFGVRDYDPETGRWTAKDPIGFAGGDTNLYGYVLNDPVNWVDPWGLDPISEPTQAQNLLDRIYDLLGIALGESGGIASTGKTVLEGGATGLKAYLILARSDYDFYKKTGLHRYRAFKDIDWDKYGDNFDDAFRNCTK